MWGVSPSGYVHMHLSVCIYYPSVLMIVGSKKKKKKYKITNICKRQCLSKSTLPSAVIKFESHSADNSGYFKTNHTIEINGKEIIF